MATHDYVIANASGAAVRADLNNALAAIVTNNSNATEPATTYPYMLWADITAGQLKLRNGTNDDWIVLQELDGTLLMKDGTVAAPGLAFASDIDTGFYRPAADQIAAATNGVERVKYGTTEVVFNDGAEDYDFRVEGSTQPSLIATNAGDDTISFGGNITSDTVYDGDVQMASQNSGPLAGFRNHAINGDFSVWQRSTSYTTPGSLPSTGEYNSADRWKINQLQVNTLCQRVTTAPAGFTYSFELSSASSIKRTIHQGIELVGQGSNGQFAVGTTWTLSVWCDNSLETLDAVFRDVVANSTNQVLLGTKVGGIVAGETSNGFTRYSQTFSTTGTAAATNTCLNIVIRTNATTSARFAGVQFEPGPVATPFEHRPISTELSLCHRYYYDAIDNAGNQEVIRGYIIGTTSNTRAVAIDHPVPMRATPTVSLTLTSGNIGSSTRYATDRTYLVVGASDTTTNISVNSYTADAEL